MRREKTIFLGGERALDQQRREVPPGEVTTQRQAMTHIGTILRDLGARYERRR